MENMKTGLKEQTENTYSCLTDLDYTVRHKIKREELSDSEQETVADLESYINDTMVAIEAFMETLEDLK